MRKKVAVILVNWNSFTLTSDCIESLYAMNYLDFDVIVVDNGSADGSGRLLKERFNEIILIQSESNLGFTGGNNLGMQFALTNKYLYQILLNNDTFVAPDFLKVLVNYMDDHPEVGVIQPLIYFNHNRTLVWNGGSFYRKWLGQAYTQNYNQPIRESSRHIKEVDWVTGCAFLTRSALLSETGLLANNLFIYYEDVDLSFRIKKAGFQLIFHPGAVIYHIAGMSNRNKTKGKEGFVNVIVHYLNIRNKIWLLKEYASLLYLPTVFLFNFFYILALMAYFVTRLRFNKFTSVLKAVKDGLTGNINYNN